MPGRPPRGRPLAGTGRTDKRTVLINVEAIVPPRLRADARRIQQVLLNLLSNAVKFTPEGGAVTVSAHGHAKDGIEVTVLDRYALLDIVGVQ